VTVTDHGDLVSALLGVPGVAAAAVEPAASGPGTLRLQLAPGADEVGVAGAVNRLLRSRFGLAVDADRVRVLGDPPAVPVVTPATGHSTQSNSSAHAGNGHAGNGLVGGGTAVREAPQETLPDLRAEPRPEPGQDVRPHVRPDAGPAVRPAGAPADGDVWHPTPRRPLRRPSPHPSRSSSRPAPPRGTPPGC
jgi:hypothetical protein